MKQSKIKPGDYYGKLTVISRDTRESKKPHWHCQCECGKKTVVRADYLASGKIISCGCYRYSKFTSSTENIEQCFTLFNEGKDIKQIARVMRISPSNAQKFLHETGIQIHLSKDELKAHREADKLRWAKKYVIFQMSLSAIAESENTTTASVSKALNKMGIPMREPGSQSAEMVSRFRAKAEEYYGFYKTGMSSTQISELFGLSSPNAVLYILKAHGYKARSPKQAAKLKRLNFRKQTRSLIKERGVKLTETRKSGKLREIERM